MKPFVKIPKLLILIILILAAGIFWNLNGTLKSLQTTDKESLENHAMGSMKSARELVFSFAQSLLPINQATDQKLGSHKLAQSIGSSPASIQTPQFPQIAAPSSGSSVTGQEQSASVAISSSVAPSSAPRSSFASGPQQNTPGAGASFSASSGIASSGALSSGQLNAASARGISASAPQPTANGVSIAAQQSLNSQPAVPVAYAMQSALNDPSTAAQVNQILNDPGASAQLTQIANDFVANVNSSGASPSSSQYAANYNSSVSLADQQFYSTFGHEAYMAWQQVQAANAGQ